MAPAGALGSPRMSAASSLPITAEQAQCSALPRQTLFRDILSLSEPAEQLRSSLSPATSPTQALVRKGSVYLCGLPYPHHPLPPPLLQR